MAGRCCWCKLADAREVHIEAQERRCNTGEARCAGLRRTPAALSPCQAEVAARLPIPITPTALVGMVLSLSCTASSGIAEAGNACKARWEMCKMCAGRAQAEGREGMGQEAQPARPAPRDPFQHSLWAPGTCVARVWPGRYCLAGCDRVWSRSPCSARNQPSPPLLQRP